MAIGANSCGLLLLIIAVGLSAAPARAVLDNGDRGPTLSAGGFRMRITNAGIIGNAFFDVGLSSDPSFEFPPNSNQELLNYAALWVGAVDELGEPRVSGGPILEWRPTLEESDRVRIAWKGQFGARRLVDDDGDGQIDEEILNGRDDDGDGQIDEDLGFPGQEMLSADYVDDRPEAVNFIYEGGGPHRPLGLSVHQEAYAWSSSGYDGIAGLQFKITNHGHKTLRRLYVGLFADLDSRAINDPAGHLDDRVSLRPISRAVSEGVTILEPIVGPLDIFECITNLDRTLPVLYDENLHSHLPAVMVIPLDHSTDPLALIGPAKRYARAPGKVSFRTVVFSRSRVPGQGGVPIVDSQRYAALAGDFPGSSEGEQSDYAVLVSCGPFPLLMPGQTIDFAVALVAAPTVDSLVSVGSNTLFLHHGTTLNLIADSTGERPHLWNEGTSGLNGHEACVEPPPGITFMWDPDCPEKFVDEFRPPERLVTYQPGTCVWTDADCDRCTGINGRETIVRWLDPEILPPAPSMRTVAIDHAVRVEWDNLPEILVGSGMIGREGMIFEGYRVYKLADWRGRESLLPPRQNWALLGAYGRDQGHGELALSTITDSSVDYDRIWYRRKHYPVGHYTLIDSNVLNGFDYIYVVTTVSEVPMGSGTIQLESPLTASFERRVVPHASSRPVGSVWVVPNPFRGHADWDRPAVLRDVRTRHVEFMGLPRAPCTIKVWTVAGDLVAAIEHDGSGGDGQASWDLVSRNGQDIESGIYLFTVESALGNQVGRFVVVR